MTPKNCAPMMLASEEARMTKRSSFVIPAALPDVAVIVDISTLPKIDAKSALAELGRISWASPQGNIPVKPAPIRLSALCTVFTAYWRSTLHRTTEARRACCGAQVCGLTAFKHDRIGRLRKPVRRETKPSGLVASPCKRAE